MRKLIFKINLGLIFVFAFFSTSFSKELSDVFIVEVHPGKIKVMAPKKHEPEMNVIIENKTLSDLLGKLQTAKGRVLGIIPVPAGKPKTAKLNIKKSERAFFIPMAPAFQAVELIIGKGAYEVPTSQKINHGINSLPDS